MVLIIMGLVLVGGFAIQMLYNSTQDDIIGGLRDQVWDLKGVVRSQKDRIDTLNKKVIEAMERGEQYDQAIEKHLGIKVEEVYELGLPARTEYRVTKVGGKKRG